MISLAYYLKVIAAIWMTPSEDEAEAPAAAAAPLAGGDQPALAGGSDEATGLRASGEVVFVAVLFGALTLILGIVPSPLFDVVRDVGAAIGLRSSRVYGPRRVRGCLAWSESGGHRESVLYGDEIATTPLQRPVERAGPGPHAETHPNSHPQ